MPFDLLIDTALPVSPMDIYSSSIILTLEDIAEAERMITTFMGDNIEARKEYISENANFNKESEFEHIGENNG